MVNEVEETEIGIDMSSYEPINKSKNQLEDEKDERKRGRNYSLKIMQGKA